MLLPLVLGFQLLESSGSTQWFAVATPTTDSHDIYVHDQQSGALIMVSTGLGVMAPEQRLLSVRKSKQLVRRRSGAVGSTNWEAFELSDPGVSARSLRADIGQDPNPGSWPAALLEALTPPGPCNQTVEAFVGDGKAMVRLKAVVCSPEQRARVDQYLQDLARTGRQPESESLGPTRKVGATELAALVTGTPVDSVAKRLGGPFQVWPSYPRGFIWLYPADDALGAYVAVAFDDRRRVAQVRALSDAKWK